MQDTCCCCLHFTIRTVALKANARAVPSFIIVPAPTHPTFSPLAPCVQSILIYSAPPLVSVGTLCFYLDFYLGSCWDSTHRRSLQPWTKNLMLILPWVVHIVIDIEVVILTLRSEPETAVGRITSNIYCHLHDSSIPVLVNAGIVALSMALLIPLEVWTGIQLYRSRANRANADFRKYLAVYLRIAACTLVALTAAGFSAIAPARVKGDALVQGLSYPCLSMAVSLIFASQKDLLNVWFYRRRRPLPSSTPEFVRPIDRIIPGEPKTL